MHAVEQLIIFASAVVGAFIISMIVLSMVANVALTA